MQTVRASLLRIKRVHIQLKDAYFFPQRFHVDVIPANRVPSGKLCTTFPSFVCFISTHFEMTFARILCLHNAEQDHMVPLRWISCNLPISHQSRDQSNVSNPLIRAICGVSKVYQMEAQGQCFFERAYFQTKEDDVGTINTRKPNIRGSN